MQIEVMSLRGSQWLQLFLEQAQIGQMVEHYKKMARKILFSEILFFLLILLIFNTQITFAFFFSFTIHLSVLALQITVELVSKNFFANL